MKHLNWTRNVDQINNFMYGLVQNWCNSNINNHWNSNQSGTKPKFVAKILATNFGFVPDW